MHRPALSRRSVLAGAGALAAAPPALAQTPGSRVLRVVPQADPPTLDPVFATAWVSLIHGTMVYESLFCWDSQLRPQPQMVQSWDTSADGLTWRFTLRDNLAFHDGSPVTTADVIASLQRWMVLDPVVGGRIAGVTEALRRVDDRSFDWRLKRPYPGMIAALAVAPARFPAIMRARDLGTPEKRVENSVGSGPFRFVPAERVSGAKLVYERNAAYVPRAEPPDGLAGGRVVKVDRVEWQIIPDPATASAALRNNEVDFVEKPSFDLIPSLAKDRNVTITRLTDLASQTMLCTNWLAPPFDNKLARQAISYIIGQEDALTAGYGDDRQWWTACTSYFICGSPYGTRAGTEDFRPDPARAKQMLQAAGYRGERLVFCTTNDIIYIGQQAEVVADQLKKAGLNIDLVWGDWPATVARVQKQVGPDAGGWSLFLTTAPGPITFNPATNLGVNTACDRKNFIGWPCDPEAERMRTAFIEADEAARPPLLDQLHRHLADVKPYTPVGQAYQPVAYRKSLDGVLRSPVVTYWNIAKS